MIQTKYIVILLLAVLISGIGIYLSTSNSPVITEDVDNSDEKLADAPLGEVNNTFVSEENSELEVETVITTTEPSLTDTKEDSALKDDIVVNEPESEVEVRLIHSEYPEYIGSVKDTLEHKSSLRYVFLGTVIQKIGENDDPATQFEVNVLQNIKGDVTGKVVLNQDGVGYINGIFFANSGDIVVPQDGKAKPSDAYLKTGATYLFSTLSTDGKQFTISVPPYDRELITTDSTLNNTQLRTLADQNARVQEFKQAVAELGL